MRFSTPAFPIAITFLIHRGEAESQRGFGGVGSRKLCLRTVRAGAQLSSGKRWSCSRQNTADVDREEEEDEEEAITSTPPATPIGESGDSSDVPPGPVPVVTCSEVEAALLQTDEDSQMSTDTLSHTSRQKSDDVGSDDGGKRKRDNTETITPSPDERKKAKTSYAAVAGSSGVVVVPQNYPAVSLDRDQIEALSAKIRKRISSYEPAGDDDNARIKIRDMTHRRGSLYVTCASDFTTTWGILFDAFDVRYWRCVMKRTAYCPDEDIRFFLYTSKSSYRKEIDVRSTVPLRYSGWDPEKKNVIIIHGFNGTERKVPMTYIRDAYLHRGDYNVFTVDWEPLGVFPCYLSSISNTRLVAQCAAQFYSYLTHNGALAKETHCVGHSLGAHICGMMSNHLSEKLYKIIGLDPARPLVDRYGGKSFRLTRDDAHTVQVVHTNAGLLGELPQVGHVDFCVNGGRMQPRCRNVGRRIRQARCSHFMSACFLAETIGHQGDRFKGVPCTKSCKRIPGLEEYAIPMGEHTPDTARGTYCLTIKHIMTCPFD